MPLGVTIAVAVDMGEEAVGIECSPSYSAVYIMSNKHRFKTSLYDENEIWGGSCPLALCAFVSVLRRRSYCESHTFTNA